MPFQSNPDEQPPARPWGSPLPPPGASSQRVRRTGVSKTRLAFAALLVVLFGARAYQDLSRPQAWAYWRDLYFSPSMSSSLVRNAGPGSSDHQVALAISGKIGPAAATWFRSRIDEAKLTTGDMVVFSSLGGDVDQAMIIGDIIRSRGLATAVGVFDGEGRIHPSHCASACVLAYVGGTARLGVPGSKLGVHRFTTDAAPERDLVADTQRITGRILGYMTRMGASPSIVEAMSATSEIRWLNAKEAGDMRLVTEPLQKG